MVFGVGGDPGARGRVPPVGLHAGRAHEQRAGGLRRRLPRQRGTGARGSRRSAPWLFAFAALVAALANALLLVVDPASWVAPLLRFVTGACMAGVYPVGMKLASTWAKGDMGLMVGILVGALTLGSASPYLMSALGGIDWRITLAAASASALAAAALCHAGGASARTARRRRVSSRVSCSPPGARCRCVSRISATSGTCGSSTRCGRGLGSFCTQASRWRCRPGSHRSPPSSAAFATIGAGALGSVAAGLLADRLGRTTITIAAMAISGTCAATIGFLYGGSPALVLALCVVWGITIVADSAQFSASSPNCPRRRGWGRC